MDIYDTLAYMNLKQEDFSFPMISRTQPSNEFSQLTEVGTVPIPQPTETDDIVIIDDDDTVSVPIPQHKSQNKMKRIHIPDAVIKPFHNRYNKNISKSNE